MITKPHRCTQQPSGRRAAILICVLVVLLIVGLLTSQTLQALMLSRRADRQRQQLVQARELLELGQMIARKQADKLTDKELVVPLSAEPPLSAGIAFSRLSPDQSPTLVRIRVRYPLGQPNEGTATTVVTLQE